MKDRAIRRRQTAKHVVKQMKVARIHKNEKCVGGYYKKRNAMNCGRPKCMQCTNPRRLFGFITLKEESNNEILRSENADYSSDEN